MQKTLDNAPVYKKRSQTQEIVRRFPANRQAVAGLIMLSILVFCAVFAPVIAPYDPIKQDLRNRLDPPSWEHIMGTDELGRDIFSRILYGARISLTVGLIAVSLSCVAGCLLGVIAGYYGGVLDNIIMRCADVLMAIPSILLNIAIVAALGTGLQNVMIAIGISSIPGYCRIMRDIDPVPAGSGVRGSFARGWCGRRVHHYPPHSAQLPGAADRAGDAAHGQRHSLLCVDELYRPGHRTAHAGMGAMLSSGREFLRDAPHLTTFPGVAIMFAVFAMNLMGDGLRDALDPKLKN